jgi:hypothetical protein
MLESIHADAITDPYGKTCRQDHRAELEAPEDESNNQEKEQNRRPCSVIRNKREEAIGPGRYPYPVDEDLQLLVHMEDSERQNQK